MKKLLLILAILSFCLSSVSALQFSDVNLGSSSIAKNSSINSVFNIYNNDTFAISNIAISSNAVSKYNISFDNIPNTLNAQSSAIVKIYGFIPSDFANGKNKIGDISVSYKTPQSSVSVPIDLKVNDDCKSNGENASRTRNSGFSNTDLTLAGDFHAGVCDLKSDIFAKSTSDAGWVRVYAENSNFYVGESVKSNMNLGGKLLSGPYLDYKINVFPNPFGDNNNAIPSEFKWINFYYDSTAQGQLLLAIGKDVCTNYSDALPSGSVILGRINTYGSCDGNSEAISYTGSSLDHGTVNIVYVPYTAPNTFTVSSSLFMESTTSVIPVVSTLTFDRVKINCDKLSTVNKGSSITAVPGQTCYLTIKLRNTGDLDFDDVELQLDPDTSDIESDDASLSIDADDTEEETLELVIDEEADGKMKVVLSAEAEAEDNSKYTAQFEFYINAKRPTHELVVSKVSIPEAKVCDGRVGVTVYVDNNGKSDEEEVAVELSVPGLNYIQKLTDLSIDESDQAKFLFSVPLNKSGTFSGVVKTFYNDKTESGSKLVSVIVNKCEEIVQPEVKPEVKKPVVAPKVEVIEKAETSFMGSTWFTVILIVANLVAASVLGFLVYGFFKKPEY